VHELSLRDRCVGIAAGGRHDFGGGSTEAACDPDSHGRAQVGGRQGRRQGHAHADARRGASQARAEGSAARGACFSRPRRRQMRAAVHLGGSALQSRAEEAWAEVTGRSSRRRHVEHQGAGQRQPHAHRRQQGHHLGEGQAEFRVPGRRHRGRDPRQAGVPR